MKEEKPSSQDEWTDEVLMLVDIYNKMYPERVCPVDYEWLNSLYEEAHTTYQALAYLLEVDEDDIDFHELEVNIELAQELKQIRQPEQESQPDVIEQIDEDFYPEYEYNFDEEIELKPKPPGFDEQII